MEEELVAKTHGLFAGLWTEFEADYAQLKQGQGPLLAHYTSIQVLESILTTGEVWFSNPLFMNDLQEMRFGMHMGEEIVLSSPELEAAAGGKKRAEMILEAFVHFMRQFEDSEALDTYVFCLSKHDVKNFDGRLSMWRGYGGQGSGVAIVFDTSKLRLIDDSPLAITPVRYGTNDARRAYFQKIVLQWCEILKNNSIPDEHLYLAAYALISVMKVLSLISKHDGFAEEEEWRVIYHPTSDPKQLLKGNLGYSVGRRGVEPKLKFKLGHLPGVTADDFALERLIDRIILGPHSSSVLALKSVQRMLEMLGHPDLRGRLAASQIPLRAT